MCALPGLEPRVRLEEWVVGQRREARLRYASVSKETVNPKP